MDKLPPILILAGGLGTRLAGIAGNLPKSLVPVKGKPFIEHQLSLLKKQGAYDVVLCVGHKEKDLRDFVGDGAQFGLAVQYSADGEKLLGTGGALLKASALTGSPFGVLYGDSYLDLPLAPIIEVFKQSGKQGLMTVFRNENQKIPSNLLIGDGEITAYNKTNPSPEMKHVDFGFSIFSPAAFDGFKSGEAFDLAAVVLALIGRQQLACCEVAVPFYEVGTESGLKELEIYLASKPG